MILSNFVLTIFSFEKVHLQVQLVNGIVTNNFNALKILGKTFCLSQQEHHFIHSSHLFFNTFLGTPS